MNDVRMSRYAVIRSRKLTENTVQARITLIYEHLDWSNNERLMKIVL